MSADLVGLVNQLRSTLGKMEVALGTIADAIVWTGSDGTIQWCNTAFARLVNRSHIFILGSKLIEVLPLMQSGSAIALEDYPNTKMLQGEYAVTEYAFERNGRSIILEISGSCTDLGNRDSEELDADCIAVLVMRDVTQAKQIAVEQQRTEAALRESELLFRAFFENVAVGTSLAASDGRILQVNPAWLQALGYSEAEFRQMKFSDYTHPDDLDADIMLSQAVFAGVRDSLIVYLKPGKLLLQSH